MAPTHCMLQLWFDLCFGKYSTRILRWRRQNCGIKPTSTLWGRQEIEAIIRAQVFWRWNSKKKFSCLLSSRGLLGPCQFAPLRPSPSAIPPQYLQLNCSLIAGWGPGERWRYVFEVETWLGLTHCRTVSVTVRPKGRYGTRRSCRIRSLDSSINN